MSAELEQLREQLRSLESVVVAFSGGLDSALVLRVAREELGEKALGLTAVSPSLPSSERADAARIAASMGARHRFVDSNELDDPNYASNPRNRCFFCKSELYRITEEVRRELGFRHVANGTNLDDLGDIRPGLKAAEEAGVRSPLWEAGLTKAQARAVARELGMDVWDKPAAACLSSRIPHGTAVTAERLGRIGRFEAGLRALGLRKVRVRFHDPVARVEVASAELDSAFALRDSIVALGKDAGFTFVTLDLEGYRTGSLNVLNSPTA